ncbi:hypothetical protein PVAP13_7NG361925 [Panicum virgatum]|uniref:Uncharacterized protein n=1 Tax=Panicum virgatum TaxID=38727 RepID=A0A8T0Q825_PANVG|nr:hypothetical protein PVAP13_7NG361925 [Panicum virgatum]
MQKEHLEKTVGASFHMFLHSAFPCLHFPHRKKKHCESSCFSLPCIAVKFSMSMSQCTLTLGDVPMPFWGTEEDVIVRLSPTIPPIQLPPNIAGKRNGCAIHDSISTVANELKEWKTRIGSALWCMHNVGVLL